jgi:hypothetical protein
MDVALSPAMKCGLAIVVVLAGCSARFESEEDEEGSVAVSAALSVSRQAQSGMICPGTPGGYSSCDLTGYCCWPGWTTAAPVAPSRIWGGGWGGETISHCGANGDAVSNCYANGCEYCYVNKLNGSTGTTDVGGWTVNSGYQDRVPMIELRGWVAPQSFHASGDPDMGFDLELDEAYLASLGVSNLSSVMWLGNVLHFSVGQNEQQTIDTPGHNHWVGTPTVHVEMNGWRLQPGMAGYNTAIPASSDPYAAPPGWYVPNGWRRWPGADFCDGGVPAGDVRCYTWWAYNPGIALSSAGTYVRVITPLITDASHCSTHGHWYTGGIKTCDNDLSCATETWDDGECDHDPNPFAPGRYVEAHPPDLVEQLSPDPGRNKTVVAVTAVANSGDGPEDASTDIYPPTPCANGLVVEEFLGWETRPTTIVLGSNAPGYATPGGARVEYGAAGTRTYAKVSVRVSANGSTHGRFKAIYKVSCSPTPPAPTYLQGEVVTKGRMGLCMDAAGGYADFGTPVQLYGCNRSWNQQWTWNPSTLEVHPLAPWARWPNAGMGWCLDIDGDGSNGSRAIIWECVGWSGTQRWRYDLVGGQLINVDNGRCLDLTGYHYASGQQLQLWDCTGNWNQAWSFNLSSPTPSW